MPREESLRRERITPISVNTECHGEVETRGALIKMLDAMITTQATGFHAGSRSHIERKGGPAAQRRTAP